MDGFLVTSVKDWTIFQESLQMMSLSFGFRDLNSDIRIKWDVSVLEFDSRRRTIK